MTTYVAMLRGIGPTNPNMHPKKLVGLFEKLGFKNVASVISSGNVIFDSLAKNSASLEARIEKALPEHLGFTSTTIIRSRDELKALIAKNPFKGKVHGESSYLLVSFLKDTLLAPDGALFTIVDLSKKRTPDVMSAIEKKYAKAVTSRTWKTVERIVKKMEALDASKAIDAE